MLSRWTPLVAMLAAAVAIAVGAPAAEASTAPMFALPTSSSFARLQALSTVAFPIRPGGSCGSSVGAEGAGPAGGNNYTVCGGGLTFVGPNTAISNVIGPTIISPGFAGSVIVASGNVIIGG
jgi:hypothetical protein